MAGGGGGAKKLIIDTILDKPAHVYLAGGALLWAVRSYQAQTTYNYHFGKIDFERRLERGELQTHQAKHATH